MQFKTSERTFDTWLSRGGHIAGIVGATVIVIAYWGSITNSVAGFVSGAPNWLLSGAAGAVLGWGVGWWVARTLRSLHERTLEVEFKVHVVAVALASTAPDALEQSIAAGRKAALEEPKDSRFRRLALNALDELA